MWLFWSIKSKQLGNVRPLSRLQERRDCALYANASDAFTENVISWKFLFAEKRLVAWMMLIRHHFSRKRRNGGSRVGRKCLRGKVEFFVKLLSSIPYSQFVCGGNCPHCSSSRRMGLQLRQQRDFFCFLWKPWSKVTHTYNWNNFLGGTSQRLTSQILWFQSFPREEEMNLASQAW